MLFSDLWLNGKPATDELLETFLHSQPLGVLHHSLAANLAEPQRGVRAGSDATHPASSLRHIRVGS
ncbi:hypothetical protein D3250_01390 [Nesterenkonia natronophila]|uniref:Uncharacterized protein n=1 Tax=Nesterenkonia natronophila TaxID=2174932 RepID=A0A3A4F3W9_9MICC|nr:hypothetical protein D3250_01390 [Nesterenkonia natronophila]